jgi:hypothetical protein
MTDTSDLVRRLRMVWQGIGDLPCIDDMNAARAEAADRLEALEAENKRLRDQFRHVDELDWRWIDELLALSSSGNAPFWRHVLRDARAALKGPP